MELKDKNENKDNYNPFEHRDVKKPISDVRATANFVKSSLGSGLLAGPLAFSNAGYGVGLVATIIIGFICGHCIHILVKTSRGCCRVEQKPSLTYPETCKSVFANGPKAVRPLANLASIVTEIALVSTYFGVCCIYVVLISDSVKQLVDKYIPSAVMPVEYYCLILLLPLCLLCQIRYLKFLALFSLIANVLLFVTYLICLWYVFGDSLTIADKKVAGDPARFPAFISTVIFAMEGVGVVMPVENEMKKPQNFLGFPSVLFVGMSIIVFLYSTLGLFGYLRFGDVLKGSITLNLPIDDWPAICAKVSIAFSIFFTYPLQFYVAFDVLSKYIDPHVKNKCKTVTDIVTRVIAVCFCVSIAVALPFLEHIINIVGALFYCVLGLIIPGIIETVFRWNDLGKFNWIMWKNAFIVIFGVCSLISGCTVTINDIIEILRRKHE